MKINEIINNIDKDEIRKIFNEHFTYDGEITIDDNGFISCSGDVKLIRKLSKLPVKFLKIDGDFNCYKNRLTTLEGSPTSINGTFYCSINQLKTLEGGPTSVGGSFYCSNNQLTTLVGCPTSVGGSFDCSKNKLTTLAGCPTSVGGNFNCFENKLTTLEGGPTSVGGSFYCSNNQLTTLVGCPTSVGGSFDCSKNKLTTLAGGPKLIDGNFYCYENPNLKNLNHLPSGISDLWMPYSPIMPLLRCLIAKDTNFDPRTDINNQIEYILNKYAGQGRKAALDCAADLLSLGKKLDIDLTMNARW